MSTAGDERRDITLDQRSETTWPSLASLQSFLFSNGDELLLHIGNTA